MQLLTLLGGVFTLGYYILLVPNQHSTRSVAGSFFCIFGCLFGSFIINQIRKECGQPVPIEQYFNTIVAVTSICYLGWNGRSQRCSHVAGMVHMCWLRTLHYRPNIPIRRFSRSLLQTARHGPVLRPGSHRRNLLKYFQVRQSLAFASHRNFNRNRDCIWLHLWICPVEDESLRSTRLRLMGFSRCQ